MTLLEHRPDGTFRESSIPVLETQRLILRAPQLGDANAVAMLANDRRVAEKTARIPHPYALGDAETFIAAANAKPGDSVFLVTLEDGTIAGACGISRLGEGAPELGYWLGVPFWGRGYATEAARAVIDYGFGTAGHDVLHAGALVNNPASRRVLVKCGFQWTGVELRRVRAIASSAPSDRFRLDRSLWASLKSWC